jgi:hypothetical protein
MDTSTGDRSTDPPNFGHRKRLQLPNSCNRHMIKCRRWPCPITRAQSKCQSQQDIGERTEPLTRLFLQSQSLQKIWAEHYEYTGVSIMAQTPGLKTATLISFPPVLSQGNGQFCRWKRVIQQTGVKKTAYSYKTHSCTIAQVLHQE